MGTNFYSNSRIWFKGLETLLIWPDTPGKHFPYRVNDAWNLRR